MGKDERGPQLAALFRAHRHELADLASVAGAVDPADGLAEAFADLYERWRDEHDPVSFLRRRAVELGTLERRPEVITWLRSSTTLDDDAIADLVHLSPAEMTAFRPTTGTTP